MKLPRRVEAVLLPSLVAAAILLAWHWGVIHTHTRIFPSPETVARGVRELARRGVLLPYIGASLFRVGSGFLLATLLGVPLGSVMGRYRAAATALNPLVQVLRPISPLAWIPLAIVFFGVTNLSTIFLIFLASFFPVVVATMNGVRAIPVIYLRAAQNFGYSGLSLWARVILPAILPQLLTGLRLALGVAWLVVVAAEMIAVDSGLGYLILDARNAGKRYDLVVAGMLLIGVIGLALDVMMRRIERLRWLRWGFSGR
jgi:NitT/TauT family transport system permease protein